MTPTVTVTAVTVTSHRGGGGGGIVLAAAAAGTVLRVRVSSRAEWSSRELKFSAPTQSPTVRDRLRAHGALRDSESETPSLRRKCAAAAAAAENQMRSWYPGSGHNLMAVPVASVAPEGLTSSQPISGPPPAPHWHPSSVPGCAPRPGPEPAIDQGPPDPACCFSPPPPPAPGPLPQPRHPRRAACRAALLPIGPSPPVPRRRRSDCLRLGHGRGAGAGPAAGLRPSPPTSRSRARPPHLSAPLPRVGRRRTA